MKRLCDSYIRRAEVIGALYVVRFPSGLTTPVRLPWSS